VVNIGLAKVNDLILKIETNIWVISQAHRNINSCPSSFEILERLDENKQLFISFAFNRIYIASFHAAEVSVDTEVKFIVRIVRCVIRFQLVEKLKSDILMICVFEVKEVCESNFSVIELRFNKGC